MRISYGKVKQLAKLALSYKEYHCTIPFSLSNGKISVLEIVRISIGHRKAEEKWISHLAL